MGACQSYDNIDKQNCNILHNEIRRIEETIDRYIHTYKDHVIFSSHLCNAKKQHYDIASKNIEKNFDTLNNECLKYEIYLNKYNVRKSFELSLKLLKDKKNITQLKKYYNSYNLDVLHCKRTYLISLYEILIGYRTTYVIDWNKIDTYINHVQMAVNNENSNEHQQSKNNSNVQKNDDLTNEKVSKPPAYPID